MLGLYKCCAVFSVNKRDKMFAATCFVFRFVFVSYEGKSVYLINVAGRKSLLLYVGCVAVFIG